MHTRDILAGAGIGAAVAYILDPDRGTARRAVVRDKMTRAARKTREGLETTGRDVRNRTRGVAAATRARFTEGDVSDEVLVERVRSRLGRVCSHPRAVDVHASEGAVTLRGVILSDELEHVLEGVRAVRGVKSVTSELEAHETAGEIPALQGEGSRGTAGLDIAQDRWAPATRALVGVTLVATGICLAAYAMRDREPHYYMSLR